jgi:hypothetical protein
MREKLDVTQKRIFEENKDWVLKEKSRVDKDEKFEEFFKEYKNLKGLDDKETYEKNLEIFFIITLNPYTGFLAKTMDEKNGDWKNQYESFLCFCGYLGNRKHAKKYFDSVDNVCAYS